MNFRMFSNVILMSLLIIAFSNLTILSIDDKNTDSMIIFFLMKPAYAQNSSSVNSTDLGVPSDNPMADLGLSNNSTNSTTVLNPTTTVVNPTTTVSNTTTSTANTTSSQNQVSGATTPEFGSIAPFILILSIVSIVVISARNRLRFN